MVAAVACADALPAAPPSTAGPTATPASVSQATRTPNPLPVMQPGATASPLPAAAPAQVLYARGGELWAVDLPSRALRRAAQGLQGASIYQAGDPWELSPDGRWLAQVRNTEAEAVLQLVPLTGGQPQEIGRFAGRVDALFWSHDSRRLAFVVNQRDELTGDLLEGSVCLYEVDGQRQAMLFTQRFQSTDVLRMELWVEGWAPGDGAIYVALAADRTTDPGTLHVLDARGGEPQLVSADYLLKGGHAVSATTGQVLLRSRVPAARTSPLYLAQAGAGGSLGEAWLLSPEDWIVGAVAWSPDGRQVVAERLEAELHGTYAVHLWLLAPGTQPRQLTAEPTYREEQPVWTPDGAGIVFGRWGAARPQPAGLWFLQLPAAEPALLDAAGARPQAAVGGRP